MAWRTTAGQRPSALHQTSTASAPSTGSTLIPPGTGHALTASATPPLYATALLTSATGHDVGTSSA